MNLAKMFVLMISRSSSKLGHLGSKTRSPGQISGKPCYHSSSDIFSSNHHESCSKCLSWWFLGQVRNWVTWGKKLGHLAKSAKTLLTLYRSHFWSSHHESCLKYFVLMSSRSNLKLGHLGSKATCRSPSQIKHRYVLFKQSSWILLKMFVLMISSSSLKLGHLGSKTRSPGQISGRPCYHSSSHIFSSNHHESCSKCLSWWFLGQVRNWVTWGQKLGHLAKSAKTLLTL